MTTDSPDTDRFARQLEELQARVDLLRRRVGDSDSSRLLEEALTELSVTVEELRVAEEEIRQQADELQASYLLVDVERRRYLDLFEFAPDGYLVTDALGAIREANQAAARLINRPQDRLIGKPLAIYVAPKAVSEFRRHLSAAAKGHDVLVWDTCLASHDRPEVDVECTVLPSRDPVSGHLLELRWRLHDITGRKLAENQLQASHATLREVSGRLEAVREEERTRIARTVHDEIGAALTAIKMDVAQVRHGLEQLDGQHAAVPGLIERTGSAFRLIDSTMDAVRSIAMEMRPAVLDDFGLVAALDWQLTEFQKRSGLECSLTVAPGNGHLPKSAATAIFRVFQEILTNVARHAEASRVEVRLYQNEQSLMLDVTDNGRGITSAEAGSTSSMGLLGMHERMRSFGGTVELTGTASHGTQVRVCLPLGAASAA